MDPKLQQQLSDLLSKLLSTLEQGASFAASQIPPLVQEKILLGKMEETVWFVLLTIWLGYMLYQTFRLFGWAVEIVKKDGECIPAFLLPALTAVIGFLPWAYSIHDTILVWFAPRIYVIEWLRELIK